MASAINLLGKIGFGFTATPDLLINLREFDPGVAREFRDTNATRGTFAKDVNRQRLARTAVAPTFACEPTHLELKHLIPWVMGAAGSGSPLVYDLSNTQANPLFIYMLPNAGDALLLNDVACDTATFSAAVGEPLSVSAQGVGLTYEEDPATPTGFGALTPDQSTQPFMLSDLALTFAGGTVQCREFSVMVNNYVDRPPGQPPPLRPRGRRLDRRGPVLPRPPRQPLGRPPQAAPGRAVGDRRRRVVRGLRRGARHPGRRL
jgi:hypothetical protein